jgi:uroporphyrin-3 C-methyltransferase
MVNAHEPSPPEALAGPEPQLLGAPASVPPTLPSGPKPRLNVKTLVLVGVGLVAVIGVALGGAAVSRLKVLEQELVKRQQASQDQSTEARMLAQQARDAAVEVAAKLALLDARVAESALQRSQVEELIASLSRSRDENMLADMESALRLAQQQASITGSAEPLLAVLRQSEERLARYNQPRLERVRRAVARDLDRVRAVALVDLPALSIRLDEAARLVDELPLQSTPDRGAAARAPSRPSPAVSGAEGARAQPLEWADAATQWWTKASAYLWAEVKILVRVTRIDRPEAMLVSPEQGYFLRENLKLRILNARLALVSRQFDQAQSDLLACQSALERYFDRSSRRVAVAQDLLRLVASQSRQVVLPRPDDTLAALATAEAGR